MVKAKWSVLSYWRRETAIIWTTNEALYAETNLGRHTSSSELEDVFQYYFEHNQYQEDDLLFLLKNSGFNIIESELIYNGRLARIVVEKPV